MDIRDLKSKSSKELQQMLVEKRNEIRELRFKISEKQLKDIQVIRKARETVAQILTLLNQRKKEPKSVKVEESTN